jgi:hypothetical protein
MKRDWKIIGEGIDLPGGAYAWVEEENKDPATRWVWHVTRGGKHGFDADGTAPTKLKARFRALAAFEAARRIRR